MGQQRWVRDHSQEASQGTPFLKGSSERPALEFTTRGSPPLQALNSGRRQLGALSTGAAPAGEARGQPSRCPPRPNTQRGHSAAAAGSSLGHSPLPPPDGRTVGFCQTAQDARRPPPSPAQAPSVAQASWFSVSLPTEDQLEKAAQDVPMASTLASHPAPSPPTPGSTPTPLLPSPLPQPGVLGAAPQRLGRQHCAHCMGPSSRPWSLGVMGEKPKHRAKMLGNQLSGRLPGVSRARSPGRICLSARPPFHAHHSFPATRHFTATSDSHVFVTT